MLVQRGANVNFVAPINKMTPLHWLAFNEDINTAKYLLDNKAQHCFNNNKNSPVDIAGFSRIP
jgi:ankyrin repeat protein